MPEQPKIVYRAVIEITRDAQPDFATIYRATVKMEDTRVRDKSLQTQVAGDYHFESVLKRAITLVQEMTN